MLQLHRSDRQFLLHTKVYLILEIWLYCLDFITTQERSLLTTINVLTSCSCYLNQNKNVAWFVDVLPTYFSVPFYTSAQNTATPRHMIPG